MDEFIITLKPLVKGSFNPQKFRTSELALKNLENPMLDIDFELLKNPVCIREIHFRSMNQVIAGNL